MRDHEIAARVLHFELGSAAEAIPKCCTAGAIEAAPLWRKHALSAAFAADKSKRCLFCLCGIPHGFDDFQSSHVNATLEIAPGQLVLLVSDAEDHLGDFHL